MVKFTLKIFLFNFSLFRMTLNSKLKDTITSEERNFMRKEKAFLVFFTVLFPLFWARELIFPFCTQPHRFWSWLLRWSLGWREIIIISHGRKRKCVWEREWALGHLLKYSPATAPESCSALWIFKVKDKIQKISLKGEEKDAGGK